MLVYYRRNKQTACYDSEQLLTVSRTKPPELPPVLVEFPTTGYEEVYARLETIGLGHVAISDCCAAEIGGDYPILKRLEKRRSTWTSWTTLPNGWRALTRMSLRSFRVPPSATAILA
ncbi:MAG: hypothetical protein PHE09_20215 [Oscillospiraceae bacterium]|nr:hypothetical protein [Oscillospiraceae bacterium]